MKKNKLFVGVICLLVLVSITGCGKKTNLSSKKQSDNTETKTEVKAKCSYYKCLSKMSLSNTVDELNNIVGIEAKSVETTVENMEKYEYDFGNDKKITVTLFSGKVSSITMAYDKKELKNSKFDYCEYFDEYEEFVKNNPCNTVESFANSDIWEVAKYLYQITEPIATLEENKETIDNFKSFFDGIDSDLCCGMLALFDELCSLGIVDEVVDFFEETGVIKGLLKINKIDF